MVVSARPIAHLWATFHIYVELNPGYVDFASCREKDLNLRRHCRQIYSLLPLAARASRLDCFQHRGSVGEDSEIPATAFGRLIDEIAFYERP